MRQIYLSGSNYDMGWQHGQQVLDLLPHITQTVTQRLSTLCERKMLFLPYLDEIRRAWHENAQPLLQMMHGIADALSLDWDEFFQYTTFTFLLDRIFKPAHGDQGCTVWAARPPLTHNGEILLAKNRDYWPDHQNLQCLAWATPSQGYRYVYLTSAGSPGVFSSGMNEVGLAVADTHVVSRDLGPGLPRYAVMMEILENHSRIDAALEFIQSIKHAGNGTIVLADAAGDMVVVETGFANLGIIQPQDSHVISTNHFTSPQLKMLWYERNRKERHGNSQKRYTKIHDSLAAATSVVDLAFAQSLMASHSRGGLGLSTICNHQGNSRRSVTISSIIFLLHERRFYLADGAPCQNHYVEFHL